MKSVGSDDDVDKPQIGKKIDSKDTKEEKVRDGVIDDGRCRRWPAVLVIPIDRNLEG